MKIEVADALTDGWKFWLDWLRVIAPENEDEIKTVEADQGSYLGYTRLVGRRNDVKLSEQIVSVPSHYGKKPLFRIEE